MFNITFDCDPSQKAPNQKSILEILEKVLSINKIKNAEISYIFGDDQLLLELKNKFFKKNHFTDVIAFRLNYLPTFFLLLLNLVFQYLDL